MTYILEDTQNAEASTSVHNVSAGLVIGLGTTTIFSAIMVYASSAPNGLVIVPFATLGLGLYFWGMGRMGAHWGKMLGRSEL